MRIAFVILLAIAGVAAAQGRVPYEGTEYFRFALHLKKLKPVADIEQALNSPRSSIIVVIGDTSRLHMIVESDRLRTFVLDGGALLIASDSSSKPPGAQGEFEEGWASHFGVKITGEKIAVNAGRAYQLESNRPYVRPRAGIGVTPSPFEIFKGVEVGGPNGVATDRPSELQVDKSLPMFTPNILADHDLHAYLVSNYQRVGAMSLFAVSLRPVNETGGRVLVMADHSVFVNGMMGVVPDNTQQKGFRFDNGNWAFANRTVDWLQGGGILEKRSQCLFIEDNVIIDKFAVEIPPPKKPPIPDLPPEVMANLILNHMNGMIDEAQEKNLFNRMVESWLGFPRILRWFLIVVTVVFLFSCLRWFMRGRRKAENAARLSPNIERTYQPKGGIVRQRTAAQIEVGNLFEAASRRVRDRFDLLGGRPNADSIPPPTLIAADVRDGEVLRRTIDWLWQIGYGETPVQVSPSQWDRLNDLLERVMSRAARGDWSFGTAA